MKNKILETAVKLLQAGKLIIYPTDTLYAIGCDATNAKAIERVYALKKRPREMPLSVLVSDFEMLQKYAEITKEQMKILKEKLPGPYTFILRPKINSNSSRVGGMENSPRIFHKLPVSNGNVGFRMIDVPIANQIIRKFGKPITATSANIHRKETPATISDLKAIFGIHINLYISGNRLSGKPSTVIDLTTGKMVRE